MPTPDAPTLEALNVSKDFQIGHGRTVHAVQNATVHLRRGSITALVGESGSGKTTLARILAQYYPPTTGTLTLNGHPVNPRSRRARRAYHRQVQLVFQDPFASLNPAHKVGYTLGRALRIHHRAKARTRADVRAQATALLERVNLTPAADFLDKFPHELSGGQRQRVVIARALAVEPRVLLGDEPVSMLDVSIRLDILNLLADLRDQEGLALLYITHDIAGARYFSDEIQVMYAGQMVEGGPTESVTQQAKHPYTRLLLASAPDPDRLDTDNTGPDADTDDLDSDDDTAAEPPSLIDPPPGCRFHPRCPAAKAVCSEAFPPRTAFPDGHWTHCWLYSAPEQES